MKDVSLLRHFFTPFHSQALMGSNKRAKFHCKKIVWQIVSGFSIISMHANEFSYSSPNLWAKKLDRLFLFLQMSLQEENFSYNIARTGLSLSNDDNSTIWRGKRKELFPSIRSWIELKSGKPKTYWSLKKWLYDERHDIHRQILATSILTRIIHPPLRISQKLCFFFQTIFF